jgi:uncharacterized GH25 family protein
VEYRRIKMEEQEIFQHWNGPFKPITSDQLEDISTRHEQEPENTSDLKYHKPKYLSPKKGFFTIVEKKRGQFKEIKKFKLLKKARKYIEGTDYIIWYKPEQGEI